MLSGFPHWLRAASAPLEHLPDDYDARRVLQRAESMAEMKRRAGRPAFSPVGPAIIPFAHQDIKEPEVRVPAYPYCLINYSFNILHVSFAAPCNSRRSVKGREGG
jgi:hypothetical protein